MISDVGYAKPLVSIYIEKRRRNVGDEDALRFSARFGVWGVSGWGNWVAELGF